MTPQEIRDRLWAEAQGPRYARSPEYMAGIKEALDMLAGLEPKLLTNPYPRGTAQADAWSAGNREGHSRWEAHRASEDAR